MQYYSVPDHLLGNRHDERYYNRRGLETICRLLELDKTTKLYLLGNILQEIGTGKGIPKEEQGFGNIAYLKIGNITKYFIDFSNAESVSEQIVQQNNMPMLEVNDILISRVGTVGNVCIYRDINPRATPSDNILVLKLRKLDLIRPFYTCIFLNSWFGQAQLRRLTKQSLQEVINQTSIKSIVIPYPTQETQEMIETVVTRRLNTVADLRKQIVEEIESASQDVQQTLYKHETDEYENWDIEKLMRSVEVITKKASEQSKEFKGDLTPKRNRNKAQLALLNDGHNSI